MMKKKDAIMRLSEDALPFRMSSGPTKKVKSSNTYFLPNDHINILTHTVIPHKDQ